MKKPTQRQAKTDDVIAKGKAISRRQWLGGALAGGVAASLGGAGNAAAASPRVPTAPIPSPAPDAAPPSRPPNIATLQDYQRAVNLWAVTNNKTFNDSVKPFWLPGAQEFWYVNVGRGGAREYILVNMAAGTRKTAFDHSRLAEALGKLTHRKLDPEKLNLEITDARPGEMQFNAGGKGFQCNLDSYEIKAHPLWTSPSYPPPFEPSDPARWSPDSPKSPDGHWEVAVENYNVFLINTGSHQRRQLTRDGVADDFYQPTVFWSPDSRKFIALRTVPGFNRQVRELNYAVAANEAQLVSFFYQKPGDKVQISRPHLFHAVPGKEVPVSAALAPNPWSLTEIRWKPDSSEFTYLFNARGHQTMRIIAVNAATGKTRAVVEEICHDDASPKFFDYSGKQFTFYLNQTNEMIWMSERDGWNHLYLYDTATGRVKNQITRGNWVVRHVVHVDPKRRQIWLAVGGIFPEQDPYFIHIIRVNFDGTGLTHLTRADGCHAVEFSPGHEYLLDTYSRVDCPPAIDLRRASDGKFICQLERADVRDLLATKLPRPQRFVAKGRDGKTDIYGVIFRPGGMNRRDTRTKYAVLENIYAGPQGAFVPKTWAPFYWQQTMAEIGFIVVQSDGMGTSQRSKPFHDVCWKNLGDSGFPDRIPWIKAAKARACPQMDLTRVGIYGTSAGGQSALRALLAFGDFYKVASANSGCHDNRVDKIWWNEQWMSYPVGPWYARQSNVTNAPRLAGKLLLVAGGMDHNVDPCCTMQVINELTKHGKDFEFLFIPPGHHGAAGFHWQYTWRRVRDFLVKNLWGIEPRGGAELVAMEHDPADLRAVAGMREFSFEEPLPVAGDTVHATQVT